MKISFFGAARTVTGSCHLIEANNKKLLIDCGMFQGKIKENLKNEMKFSFNPLEIDYVVLSHAHIDHSGRIPLLFKEGFRGEIITTRATKDLCSIMLPDSGHIQEFEAQWRNKKLLRAGKPLIKPLYTQEDAEKCLTLFNGQAYNKTINLGDTFTVVFRDAGHILGSSIIEMWIKENDKETKLVCTGDLGNKGIPLLRNPEIIEAADYLIMESTYGNRLHHDTDNKAEKFMKIVHETIERGGNVIIPSFAVGRTQEIIYELNKEYEKYESHINKLRRIPVYIDSPLAISATEIFKRNLDCFDEETREYIRIGDDPLEFNQLHFSRTADESRALNNLDKSSIIISASGMCEAGRIKHHLKHNLWKAESTILFVGYQAEGTLGRKLINGKKKVRIFSDTINVRARIEFIEGYSGHADQNGLMDWLSNFRNKPKKVFLVHGEEESINELAGLIQMKFDIDTAIPHYGDSYELLEGEILDYSHSKSKDSHYTYKCLRVLDRLETLKEELTEASDMLKEDMRKGMDEKSYKKFEDRINNLENDIVNLIS